MTPDFSVVIIRSLTEAVARCRPPRPLPRAELAFAGVSAGTAEERRHPRTSMLNAFAGKRMLAQGLNSVNCLLGGLRSVVGRPASSHSSYSVALLALPTV